ncbi:MAG: haloacid dehalogenase [Porticoccaceae bacterium]|nr:MAG: haloacid dehalogenase [Porticoccaceae bacterium]
MLKALFFDLDETLCDTLRANRTAVELLARAVEARHGPRVDGTAFAEAYLKGIYREWDEEQRARYLPLIEKEGEAAFRIQLIRDLLARCGVAAVSEGEALALQEKFDRDRLAAFDFYPGIPEFLREARRHFTLVVITNGPEFSQLPKIERVNLPAYVDHILVGGQEPEEKPARSIFQKALRLAGCEPWEAVHVGDNLHTDVAGALSSGLTALWVSHQRPLDAELGIAPHHQVVHPSEIPAAIWRLAGDGKREAAR